MKKRQNQTNVPVVVDWRSQAQAVLPELAEEIAEATNPMQLWVEIGFAFDAAYNEPRDEDLIRRIYSFAHWCIEQPRSRYAQDDLFTCVVVCFYQDIPASKAARADMPRWFTAEEVRQNKEVFSYLISSEEYEGILAMYKQGKQKRRLIHPALSHSARATCGCRALTPAPVMAILVSLGREVAATVCRSCLDEMVRLGEWEIPGANLKRRFDIAVYDKDERLRLVVDVKNYLYKHEGDAEQWGTRIRRNLVRHAAIPIYVYFLLAVYPAPFSLWFPEDAPDAPPRFLVDVQAQMPQLQTSDALDDYQQQIDAVSAWLAALMNASGDAEPSAWLHESGLSEAIQGGRIVRWTVQAETRELLAA